MCFRFVGVDARAERAAERLEEVRDRFVEFGAIGAARIEVFPGDLAGIVVQGGELIQGRWGLQPAWATDPNFGKRNAYNARAETLAEKPTFRSAYRSRRCVIPASSFFERGEGRWLQIVPRTAEGFSIAGLWEPGETPSFTMVTTEANTAVAEANDRMPAILTAEDAQAWTSSETPTGDLPALLVPCPVGWLAVEDGGPIVARRKAVLPSLFDGG